MSYAAQHAFALDLVARKGAAVSFTKAAGTVTESTGMSSGITTTTVAGRAARVQGDPKVYAQLSLKQDESPTLFFVPTTIGEEPELGMNVTWGSTKYTVARVFPVAPDGTTIAARVLLKR